MSNIVSLPNALVQTGEPNPALIESLERMLDEAKSGLLQSFFATGFRSDGLRMSCIFPHTDVYQTVGAIEMLKDSYIKEWTI